MSEAAERLAEVLASPNTPEETGGTALGDAHNVREFIEGMVRLHMNLPEFEFLMRKAFVTYALKLNNGNQAATARAIGLHRNTVRTIMRELGIVNTGVNG
jgi:DNA-binding PucR family transcriptional regulator